MSENYRGVFIQQGDSFRVMSREGTPTTISRYEATVNGKIVRGELLELKAKIDALLGPSDVPRFGT